MIWASRPPGAEAGRDREPSVPPLRDEEFIHCAPGFLLEKRGLSPDQNMLAIEPRDHQYNPDGVLCRAFWIAGQTDPMRIGPHKWIARDLHPLEPTEVPEGALIVQGWVSVGESDPRVLGSHIRFGMAIPTLHGTGPASGAIILWRPDNHPRPARDIMQDILSICFLPALMVTPR